MKDKINNIIKTWKKEGHNVNADGLPLHPEYVYRQTGKWKGWSNFLGVSPDNPEYTKNTEQDALENDAFSEMSSVN